MRATKQKDAILKTLKSMESVRDALKREKETILSQTNSLEREIDIEKREAAAARAQGAPCNRTEYEGGPPLLAYGARSNQFCMCLLWFVCSAEEVRSELKELEQALTKADDSTARQVAITKLNLRMIKDLEAEISAFKVSLISISS